MTVKMADRGIKGMVPGFRDDLKVVVGGGALVHWHSNQDRLCD